MIYAKWIFRFERNIGFIKFPLFSSHYAEVQGASATKLQYLQEKMLHWQTLLSFKLIQHFYEKIFLIKSNLQR